jgi:hypothetical protein
MNSQSPSGGTPLYCAIDNFADPWYAPKLSDVFNSDSYLLVVADGCENCGLDCPSGGQSAYADDFTELVSFLLALQIHTFVIGFGDTVGGDFCPEELNAIAAAGGTEYTTFIDALGQDELDAALQQIAGQIATCELVLDPDSGADPTKVNLYADGELILFDQDCAGGSGWDWVDAEHTIAVLCSEYCDLLISGELSEITATFGCPTAVLE